MYAISRLYNHNDMDTTCNAVHVNPKSNQIDLIRRSYLQENVER